MNRAAYIAAVVAGFAAYYAVRFVVRQLDVASWVRAWEDVPVAKREAFRNTLLAEEGVASNGG